MDRSTRPPAAALIAALVGAALLVVSPFLVWGKVDIVIGTISQTGIDAGAGWVDVVVGVLVAGLAGAWVAGAPRRLVQAGWVVLAIGVAGVSFYELTRVHDCAFFIDEIDECVDTPRYGSGLFVALVGAAVTLAGAALAFLGPDSDR